MKEIIFVQFLLDFTTSNPFHFAKPQKEKVCYGHRHFTCHSCTPGNSMQSSSLSSSTNLECPTPACTSRDPSSKINCEPQKLTPDVSSQSLAESSDSMLFEETPWPECLPVPSPASASTSDDLSSSTKATKVKSKHKSTAPSCRKCTSSNLKKRPLQKRNSKLKAKLAKLRLEIKELKAVSVL